jgi:hypothetical protein
VNDRIRSVARWSGDMSERSTYGFLCSCGCSALVVMSIGEFDACGGEVLKPGHRPVRSIEQPPGELFADPMF